MPKPLLLSITSLLGMISLPGMFGMQESGKPTISRDQLHIMVQRAEQDILSGLIRTDASQMAGNAGFLRDLELDAEQRDALARIIVEQRERVKDLIQELREVAADPERTKEDKESVSRRVNEQLSSCVEDAMVQLKRSLLPHQVEKLDQLLSQVRFQSVYRVCQLSDAPWTDVCAAYLDLSSGETLKFKQEADAAVHRFQQRLEDAKRDFARELGSAAPESKKDEWKKTLGDDPSGLIEALIQTSRQ